MQSGELSPRTWEGYKIAADIIVAEFGKARLVADLAPDDFAALRKKMAARWGPTRLGNAVQCVRSVLKYAYDAELIDRPVRFGAGFTKPTKRTMRLHRAAGGLKLFGREEIHGMLEAAGAHLRAMILLGVNCGFGNADCGTLPIDAVDLDAGWIDFPRPKTGIARRCPLWPETVRALRESLAARKGPADPADAGLVFITSKGCGWHKGTHDNPLSREISTLLRRAGIVARRGLNFYGLRHTFRTAADEAKDQPAADAIMGHEVASISAVYRERISDERLRAVADHVRGWLFGKEAGHVS